MALAISRKDDHSACIFRDFAVGQHFCVTHLLAYCHQNAVRIRCARYLLEPRFNNKSECLTRWQVMYRFQKDTHYTACHHWYIFRQHNHNSNIQMNYAGFDINFSAPDSADDEMNIIDDTLPVLPVIEKCSFQRNNIRLPPDIAFQVHLMSQLNKHRGNDLNMFHEIITCMKSHAVHHNVDFLTLQILSRKQLVLLLTKYYQNGFPQTKITFRSTQWRYCCHNDCF